MIPNLGRDLVQSTVIPWLRTPADDQLRECDSLTIPFDGKEYPIWKFMEAYERVVNKEGEIKPLMLNSAQIKTYQLWDKQYREKGYVRCNEGKGRQMGSSTLIHAFGFAWMISHPGFKIGILADTEDKGMGLLTKYKFFYMNLPEPLRKRLREIEVVNNSSMLAFDFGGGLTSSVEVIVATENAGASKTFQMLHCSEVALWEKIGETLTALERTVGNVKNTFIFRETTARGPNEWKKYYENGKKGTGRFKSIFLPWYLESGYCSKYDGHVLNEYERMLVGLGISLDQIQWWREEYEDCQGDLSFMKREFPSTEAEMWQSTSISIFDSEITARRKEETEGKWLRKGSFIFDEPTYESDGVGAAINLESPRFVEDELGGVTIFEEPIEGHPYAVCCDPANGGEDFHAVQVIDCSNDRQVATYHKRKVDADTVAYQSYCLWLYYANQGIDENGAVKTATDGIAALFGSEPMKNRVYVTGERNLSTYWLHMMERLGAGPVSRDRQDNESLTVINQLGWRTTPTNRQNMIDDTKIAFRASDGRIINDYETLCEMENFQYKKSGANQTEKAQAIGGAHDDLVMALCGYFYCKARGDFECNVIRRNEIKAAPYRYNPFSEPKDKDKQRFEEW